MPAGYEKLRDALKRKGKSDEEAKTMAARIWNSKHKDNPVTNKKHEMSRIEFRVPSELLKKLVKPVEETAEEAAEKYFPKLLKKKSVAGAIKPKGWYPERSADSAALEARLDLLHEMGLGTQVTPGGMLGNTYVKGYQGDDTKGAQSGHGKTAYRQKKKDLKKAVALSKEGLWPSGEPTFMFDNPFGAILLGIPAVDFDEAEALLAKKLGRKVPNLFQPKPQVQAQVESQVKTGLAAPLQKYRTNPNPNPNATSEPQTLPDALAELLRRRQANNTKPLEFARGDILRKTMDRLPSNSSSVIQTWASKQRIVNPRNSAEAIEQAKMLKVLKRLLGTPKVG
jgi:hypothetical protein